MLNLFRNSTEVFSLESGDRGVETARGSGEQGPRGVGIEEWGPGGGARNMHAKQGLGTAEVGTAGTGK